MNIMYIIFLANVEVSEALLLRDIVFIFQGINGQFIKYNADSSSYIIDPKVFTNNSVSFFFYELNHNNFS